MEILLSVVLGELTTRSIDFLLRKYSKPPAPELEDHLCRVLLRAQVIVDEAMGRYITNQAMLHQLNKLRDGMHRGYYLLDTFRYQSHKVEEATKDKVVSQTLPLSKLNSVKGLHYSNRNTEILEQLQKALHNLSSIINDSEEMVMFLMSYPRMYRQPYSMHIQLGNCMFGRQLETELAINFLLQSWPHGSKELEVLPIVGPGRVGKSTLVAHVCKDERVLGHFSKIFFMKGHDFTDDDLATLREGCAMEHRNHVSNMNKDGRLLLVVELDDDLDEGTWNKLYFASKKCMPSNSKIIVTSCSEKIIKFGTTKAVSLKNMSDETFWYFFKTLTFGSTDPEMHKNFVHVAMEIVKTLSGCFIGANITAYLLRDNFDIHYWCKMLAFMRMVMHKHVSKSSEHPFDLISEKRLARLGRMVAPSEDLVLYDQSELSPQEDIPSVRIQDVMYGSAKPQGRFEVLAWTSPIPPYYSYVSTCEIQDLKRTTTKRKRSVKNRVTLC